MFHIKQKLKIKTTIRNHFILTRTAKKIRSAYNTQYLPGCELFEPSYIMRDWLWEYCDISYQSLTYFGIFPREMRTYVHQWHMQWPNQSPWIDRSSGRHMHFPNNQSQCTEILCLICQHLTLCEYKAVTFVIPFVIFTRIY